MSLRRVQLMRMAFITHQLEKGTQDSNNIRKMLFYQKPTNIMLKLLHNCQ